MEFFSDETRNKLRLFFERTGLLFPTGKRSKTDRRMNTIEPDYWDMPERRSNMERRQRDPSDSDLSGMV